MRTTSGARGGGVGAEEVVQRHVDVVSSRCRLGFVFVRTAERGQARLCNVERVRAWESKDASRDQKVLPPAGRLSVPYRKSRARVEGREGRKGRKGPV